MAGQILTSTLATQSMVLRNEFLCNLWGWNEALPRWNDWELGVRVLLASSNGLWLKSGPYHRIYAHKDSITGDSFADSAADLLSACLKVESDIIASDSRAPKNSLLALGYRMVITAALFVRENNADAAHAMATHARGLLQTPNQVRLARWLFKYAARGGRGAWRAALAICRTSPAKN